MEKKEQIKLKVEERTLIKIKQKSVKYKIEKNKVKE